MVIYKKPSFENDSYMFVIDLENDELVQVDAVDVNYTMVKSKLFRTKKIDKDLLFHFRDRPSLLNFNSIEDLSGTIYTHTCEGKNKMDYEHIISNCKKFHKVSRRCAINFADTLSDYLNGKKNTSCLNSIHFYRDNVTLYFRASDMTNELLIDLKLIKHFFIEPVGKFKTLTVMCSTAQNVEYDLNNLIK